MKFFKLKFQIKTKTIYGNLSLKILQNFSLQMKMRGNLTCKEDAQQGAAHLVPPARLEAESLAVKFLCSCHKLLKTRSTFEDRVWMKPLRNSNSFWMLPTFPMWKAHILSMDMEQVRSNVPFVGICLNPDMSISFVEGRETRVVMG